MLPLSALGHVSLADIIAERRLDLGSPGDTAFVHTELGRPVADPSGGRWVCALRVTSPNRILQREAFGPDGFEALRTALQMIRQELIVDLPKMGAVLTWHGRDASEWFPNLFPR